MPEVGMKVRSRAWTLTINNYTETDFNELDYLINNADLEYWIFGFEGIYKGSKVHPHMHVYLYFAEQHTASRVLKYFTKHHHIENVKASFEMAEYCRGYELKDTVMVLKDVRENRYWECEKPPPANGRKKNNVIIADYLKEGHSLLEIKEKFPTYYMVHKERIHEYIEDRKVCETKFYYYIPHTDAITEMCEIMPETKFVYVNDLAELSAYPEHDNIIYAPDDDNTLYHRIQLWPRGGKILYKFGYKYAEVKCNIMIIITTEGHERMIVKYYKKLKYI